MSAFRYRAKREIRRRRLRRYLHGLAWGIGLGALLIVVTWNFFRDDLGSYAANVIRDQARRSLQGALDFENLYIDRAGRAIFSNVSVLDVDGNHVITAPTAVASVNPLAILGPNRGGRSVVLTLLNPEVTVIRRADGSINLSELARPKPPSEKEPWGYVIRVRGGTVHYTDHALLRQGYPRWPKLRGLLKDLFDELGYNPEAYAAEQVPSDETTDVLPHLPPFKETLGISGSFTYNPPREEMALNVTLARPEGSEVVATGTIDDQGRQFNLNLALSQTELASLEEYIHSLFPNLQLAMSGSEPTAQEPLLAGLLDSAVLRLSKPEGKPLEVNLETNLLAGRFNTQLFPRMDFSRLEVDYVGPEAELRLDYDMHSAGLAATGSTGFDFNNDQIGGDLRLYVTDFAELYRRLGLKGPALHGQLNADLALGGRLGLPNVSGTVRGSRLAAGGASIGNLFAEGAFEDGRIDIQHLRLRGGGLPLTASGSYDTAEGDGSAKVNAGPLQANAAIALARALRIDLPPALHGAAGSLSANADLRFSDKRVSGSATLSSPSITLSGQSFTDAYAKVNLERSLLRIQELRANMSTGSRFAQLGFRSEGPLRLAVKASGTAQLPPAKSPALNITGTLGTLNLVPEQALVSYDLTGPLKAPNFKAQLKTTGDTPLLVNATGKVGTPLTLTATIDWGPQRANFDGSVNLAAKSVNGTLTASDIELARVVPDSAFSGNLSLTANVSGPFDKLTASGTLSAPRIAGALAERDLAVTDLSLGFNLAAGSALTVRDGSFAFGGSSFTLDGTLGGVGQELTLRSDSFDLARALAAGVGDTPVSVEADGPLVAVFSGTLKRPQLRATYASGPGSIEGRAFDNLELALDANTERIVLERLALTGLGGSASATGTVTLSGGELADLRLARYELIADAESLEAALIAPLLGMPLLADTTGTLSGEARLAGTRDNWDVTGSVTLEDGSFQGVPFDSAHVAVATQNKAIVLTAAYLVRGNSRIVATGSIGPGKRQFDLQVGAESFNLEHLRPFLPAQYRELSGRASFNLTLRPPDDSGYPRIEGELRDVGGLVFAGVRFSEMEVALSLREGILLIETARLVSHGSTLRLSGRLSPALFSGQPGRAPTSRALRQQPMNLRLQTENFRIGVIRALLPPTARDALPGGTLTADLSVTGRPSSPQLRGTIDFNFTELPATLPVQLASVAGRVVFGDNNRFTIENVQIGGGDAGLQQIEIAGGGRYSLSPPSLTAGAITVNLSPAGRFIQVADVFGYSGALGGQITITPPERGGRGFVIGGQLIVNEPGGDGTLALNLPDREGGGGPGNYSFDNFQVLVQEGMLVSFAVPLVQVSAGVAGSLTINGRPGATARYAAQQGTQPLSIAGRLDITSGSLLLYRHEVRLTGDENYIAFSGQPGDYFPRLTAEATLVLRDVLRGTETIEYTGAQSPLGAGDDDVTVFFSFNNMRLGPGTRVEDMRITSDPPLPQETLRAYLYGDLYDVLAGRSDLGQFAQRELLAYSTSFISRQIERSLELEQFAFGGGGTDENPFFVSVEKELSPDVYLAYFRTFYTETQQKEELTLRYRFFHTRFAGLSQNASLAVGIVRRELQEDAVEVELQYNVRFGGKKRDPEEVAAARAAAEAGQPLSPEQQRLIRDPDAPPATPVQETKPIVTPKETQAAPEQSAETVPPAAPAQVGSSPLPGSDTPDGVTENVAVEIEIKPPPPPAKKVATAKQP